ncbi:MAG: tRNA pseudouridine(38-40) synthase TruA [FCB group bacterium]|nr:tRNA pseudouridine(38-40) synthase TruA [FCB group bacterium]
MFRKNIKLVIEYKGTAYSGWQSQADGKTIQDEIISAIFKTTNQRVNLIGAGRTDAGVHALGQVANFIIEHPLETEKYKNALNYYLPSDIRIKKAEEVPVDFNARFDAVSKRYRYLIALEKSALYREYRWEYVKNIDFSILGEGAKLVVGQHDFSPFCVVSSRKENNVCRIDFARWSHIGPLFVFEIRGNRFLHRMVRSLVGAMVNIATTDKDQNKQNLTLGRLEDIIKNPTMERITFTAPAHGLYLVSVKYEKDEQK